MSCLFAEMLYLIAHISQQTICEGVKLKYTSPYEYSVAVRPNSLSVTLVTLITTPLSDAVRIFICFLMEALSTCSFLRYCFNLIHSGLVKSC
jgi:hypothetical protein